MTHFSRIQWFGAALLASIVLAGCTSGEDPTPSPPSPAGTTATTTPGPPVSSVTASVSPTGEVSPAPTASPTATATPELPPDLGTAEAFYRNGEYERAVREYQRVAAVSGPQGAAKALLGAARASVAAGNLEAGKELAAAARKGADAATALAALYLDARMRLDGGEYEIAALEFGEYADAHGPAEIYAREDAATAYALSGDDGPAQKQLERAIALGPSDKHLATLLLALGQSYIRTESWASARETFGRLLELNWTSADSANALYHLALATRGEGDARGWQDQLIAMMTKYPESPAASMALQDLVDAKAAVPPVVAGTVYYKSFRDTQAVEVLSKYFEAERSGQEAQQGAYYRATALERLGKLSGAIDWYRRAYEYAPGGAFAERALWWRAVAFDLAGDTENANAGYARLLKAFPDSAFAPDAGFRIALNSYRTGDTAAAESFFREQAEVNTGEARSRALLWLGKTYAGAGRAADARAAWQTAVNESDGNYYALRAEALLAGKPDAPGAAAFVDDGINPGQEPDWLAIEGWIAMWSKRSAVPAEPTAEAGWAAAMALLELGEERRARDQLRPLLLEHQLDPYALLDLARGFRAAGLTDLAAQASALLYGQAPASGSETTPRDLYRLAFPVEFLPIVRAAAREFDIDPLLLYALVRQESFFDPSALSFAGARGLTQVIPSTGADIASQLGVSDFDPAMLNRPAISLRFGAYYVGRQIKDLGSVAYHGLAAYNAGYGNASRWLEAGGEADVDLYVEQIDLDEPKLYVRYVMQNYARYRAIYRGKERPTLLP